MQAIVWILPSDDLHWQNVRNRRQWVDHKEPLILNHLHVLFA